MFQNQGQQGGQGQSKANRVTLALRGFRVELKAQIVYPHVINPKQEPNKAPKYSAMFMWDINDPINAQAVNSILGMEQSIKSQFHPTIPAHSWAKPLKDFNVTVRNDGKPHPELYTGKQWINASNSIKFRPSIQMLLENGTRRDALPTDEIEIYSGRQVLVSLSFYGLDGENGKYGVSTNFDAMIVLPKVAGEEIAVGSGVDFNTAFDKFASIMGPSFGNTSQGQQTQQFNQGQQTQQTQQFNQGQQTQQFNQGQQTQQFNQGQQTQQTQQFNQGQQTQQTQQFNQGQQTQQTQQFNQGNNFGFGNNGNNFGTGLV